MNLNLKTWKPWWIMVTIIFVNGTHTQRKDERDFPGGTMVKNPPANAGDTGLRPGPGRSQMLWSN